MYTNEGSVITVGSDMMTLLFALLESESNSKDWTSIGNNRMLTIDVVDDN